MRTKRIVNVVVIALIVMGVFFIASIFWHDGYEQTDDAQIEQYISPIFGIIS
ncbi:MAG: hypothetical protein IJ494_05385 [Bacteroides sp.]|nr:hypothetical protein [Bacteroides sp.]